MAQVLWKVPRRWLAPGMAQRAMLYPALYLRTLGLTTALRRAPSRQEVDEAEAIVLVVDGPLSDDDRELLGTAADRRRPLVVSLLDSPDHADLRLIETSPCVVAAPADRGPLASAYPGLPGSMMADVAALAGRSAEDRLLRDEVPAPTGGPALARGRADQVVVVVEDAAALAQLSALAPRLRELGLSPVIVSTRPEALGPSRGALPSASVVDAAAADLLEVLGSARMLLCALGTAAPLSPVPGIWVRTALAHGVPAVGASHPSIDGLAHLCILDDWERGVTLYSRELQRLTAAARAQAEVLAAIGPRAVAGQWRAALELAREHVAKPKGAARPRTPLLMILFDLNQDLEVLLPVMLALRDRARVRLRIVVTDWLETESPRTLQALRAHGFRFELVDRGAARKGIAPDLGAADAVLTGSDTTAGPHRAAHGLARRAAGAGRRSFTVQHGLENIGLTYKDARYGPEVAFASDVVFTWGPIEALPEWVRPETRKRTRPVGSPKRTPPPAGRLRFGEGDWRCLVGVFENLHWDRFDDEFRSRFLADLQDAASANPAVLFAVKPHHAGRWLGRERSRLAERPNIRLLDPADPAWQPYTAPDIIPSLDLVITTPSTVALDAARAGKPVAIAAYDLEVEFYAPLPTLRSGADWSAFVAASPSATPARAEDFLNRILLPGRADHRIAAAIEAELLADSPPSGRSAADPPARLGLRRGGELSISDNEITDSR